MRGTTGMWGRLAVISILAALGAWLAAGRAEAQDKPATKEVIELTPEEKAERDSRKACKVAICAAFRNRKPGDDISCHVLKTWRKEAIEKIVAKGGLSWPWGKARCETSLKLRREALIKAMTEKSYELTVDTHTIACALEREKDNYEVKFDIAPKVTFKDGKAEKAALHWGKIDAPALAKGALWSMSAADNTFGVMQGAIVEDINDFVSAKCDEVKDDWAGK